MLDRRRSHRLEIEIPARYTMPGGKEVVSVAAALNINATGICLSTKHKLSIGEELPMQVALPDEQMLNINAKVIWVREIVANKEYKIGVKIMEPMTPDEAQFVKFYAKEFMSAFKE